MKRKRGRGELPSLDELYVQLKEAEASLSGLSSLLRVMPSVITDTDEPVNLPGVGILLEEIGAKLKRTAARVSEHALNALSKN